MKATETQRTAAAIRARRGLLARDAAVVAFTWHSIDAELAALTFDSAAPAAVAAVRAGEASPRFLTFTSADLTIELEIGPDAIIGQIVPPQAGHADACPARGAVVTAPIDDIGCFIIRPRPTSPFRLHCHADSGVSAQTTWITLQPPARTRHRGTRRDQHR
jgi:hypothetical protein